MIKFIIEVNFESFDIVTYDNAVTGALPKWSDDEREQFENDINDCTSSGDCEEALLYMLNSYDIEWVCYGFLNETMQKNCEYIYCDGLDDEAEKFQDIDTCKLYALWQAACDYVYNRDMEKAGLKC